MSYRAFLNYLDGIGLEQGVKYDYLDKDVNVMRETERMINRSTMMFDWHGLPDTIPQKQLELILQMQGYAVITLINGKPYACYAGLGGVLDEYLRPTIATVSIPYLHFNETLEIGKDCALIRNDTLQQGLLPLYSKYTTLISENEISILLALVNQRIESIISASDNNTIESARQYLKDVMDGKQGIIADNAFLQSLSITNNRQVQGQLRELVETLQYLKASMYNEIGLATNYNLKKERVSYAEVELNTDNLYPMIDDMYYCREQGIEDCKALYGDFDGVSVEYNSSWDYRIANGEPITTKGNDNGSIDNASNSMPNDVNNMEANDDGVELDTGSNNQAVIVTGNDNAGIDSDINTGNGGEIDETQENEADNAHSDTSSDNGVSDNDGTGSNDDVTGTVNNETEFLKKDDTKQVNDEEDKDADNE